MRTSRQQHDPRLPVSPPAPRSSTPRLLPALSEPDFNRVGKLGTNVSLALEALWTNRLRSLLTTLGIFIGVASLVISGSQDWNTRIQGVTASFQGIQNWTIAEGDWFSSADEQAARSVAVLGQTVAQNLFTVFNIDPIGKTIRVGGQLFRVVGVL